MILKCSKCGYTKNVREEELMESTECELCGSAMLFEESADYLADQEKEEITNETTGMNEQIDNMLISSMIKDIEKFGEAHIWEEINTTDLDLRITLLPIYLEAQKQIKED